MAITREELTALFNAQSERFDRAIEAVRNDIAAVKSDIAAVKADLQNLDSRVERQERRLSAIETFPLPPTRHQSRFYGTEVHSVSMPEHRRNALPAPKFGRVRLGYAG